MANINQIALATFGIVPGGYRGLLESYYHEHGEDNLTNALLDLMGGSNAQIAEQIVNNLFGGLIGNRYGLALKAQVVDWIGQSLDAYGSSRGAFVNDLLDVIDGLSYTDPVWGSLAKRFDYCIQAAEQYQALAGSRASTDLTALMQIMHHIDDSEASVSALASQWQSEFGSSGSGGSASSPGTASGSIVADDFAAYASQLAQIISLNDETGTLSTASLHPQVIARTGTDLYFAAFDPARYHGSGDGTFTVQELGFSHLGNLPATVETLESLFFGTLVKALKGIDVSEALSLQAIATDDDRDGMIDDAHIAQLLDMLATPASTPLLTDDQIAALVVESGEAFVRLVGGGDNASLIEGLLFL